MTETPVTEATTKLPLVLSSDSPLTDPNDDRLGYRSFANALAKSLVDMTPTEGIVLALYGRWGSGKSTVLNFTTKFLSEMPEEKRPVVITFNPWWFAGQEDLVRRFFSQLRASFQRWSVLTKKARESLATLAILVSMVPTQAAWAAAVAGKAIKGTPPDVVDVKRQISDALRDHDKKIVIVLDDIDRLTSVEMTELFRLLKSVANFPNVIYLVSFDKDVAVQALEGMQGGSGEDYLEKIVQVPFDLPLPDRLGLRSLLFDRINAVIASTDRRYFDHSRWRTIFFDGVDHFINTPRDAVRLANSIAVTYPVVEGEVNATDFIGLETLRVFRWPVYDIVRRNREAFAGTADSLSEGVSADAVRTFHDTWLSDVPDEQRDATKQLVKSLFPGLEGLWDNVHYSAESAVAWRNELRVCSREVFPTYFRLAVPEGDISNTEMLAALASANKARVFAETLVRYADETRPDGSTRIRAFLDVLENYIPILPNEDVEPALRAVLQVGDRLLRPEDYPRQFLDFGTEAQISRVTYRLLRRIENEDARYKILKDALSGPSIIVPTREISSLEPSKEDGRPRRPEADVSLEHLETLRQAAVGKLRDAAVDGSLIQNSQLLYLLYRWRDWAGPDEPRNWVRTITDDEQNLLLFLRGIFNRYIVTEGDETKVGYRFDKKYFEDFLDVDAVRPRLEALDKNNLSEEQREAIDAFFQAVDDPSGRWDSLESDLAD